MHDKEVRENSKRGGKERKIAIKGADGEREGEGKGKMVKQRKGKKEMVTGNRREERGRGEWIEDEKERCRPSWKEGGKRSS